MNFVIEASTEKRSTLFTWKVIFLWVFVFSLFGFLLISLFDLQIVNGEKNLIQAQNISHQEDIVRAPRGVIYDSKGRILAKNAPAYSVYIKPIELSESEKPAVFGTLGQILQVDQADLLATYDKSIEVDKTPADSTSSDTENKKNELPPKVTLSNDITYDQYISILIHQSDLPGVYAIETPMRIYPYKNTISHIIGYVSDINEAESKETGLDKNSNIGKEGLEKSYDSLLRGKDGMSIKTRDIFHDKSQEYISEAPVSGNNIVSTIDIDWQLKLEQLLNKQVKLVGGYGGSAIVMETKTGNIKAMVSNPSYDNNLFAKGISAKDYNKLSTNDATPLVNRAIALQLPTGSTFKPMVAATALQEGVISSSTTFTSGCVTLPQYKLCEADHAYLGTMTVVEGIGRSSNVFFCKTALAITTHEGGGTKGINKLIEYTDQFGIGHKTGINLPGEQAGTMASPKLKMERQKEPWYLADICNTTIGQGLVTATPIQMVAMVSAIGNRGTIYQPNLVARIENQDGKVVEEVKPKVLHKVNVSPSNFDTIRRGMEYAVNGSQGSGWLLRGVPGNPYVKTGSADATEYRGGKKVSGAHSWVIGGFKYQGTDYSFVVFIQEGGRGYKSVPVIADFIRWVY